MSQIKIQVCTVNNSGEKRNELLRQAICSDESNGKKLDVTSKAAAAIAELESMVG